MDALNFMLADLKVSPHLRRRARSYMRNTKATRFRKGYNELISSSMSHDLSVQLKKELRSSRFLPRVWYLRLAFVSCGEKQAEKLNEARPHIRCTYEDAILIRKAERGEASHRTSERQRSRFDRGFSA